MAEAGRTEVKRRIGAKCATDGESDLSESKEEPMRRYIYYITEIVYIYYVI